MCLRPVTFLGQMRVEGEGHLTAACLKEASRRLILGSSAVAGERNSGLCFFCSLGPLQAVVVVRGTYLCWYVCQVVAGLEHLPFSVPSFWWWGELASVRMCRAFRRIC